MSITPEQFRKYSGEATELLVPIHDYIELWVNDWKPEQREAIRKSWHDYSDNINLMFKLSGAPDVFGMMAALVYVERCLTRYAEVTLQRADKAKLPHLQDEDCIVDDDHICMVCKVVHGDPCGACGAKAYHKLDCKGGLANGERKGNDLGGTTEGMGGEEAREAE